MNIIFLFIVVLLLIFISIIEYKYYKIKEKTSKEIIDKIIKKEKNKIEKELDSFILIYNEKKKNLEEQLILTEKILEKEEQNRDNIIKNKKKEIDKEILLYSEKEKDRLEKELEQYNKEINEDKMLFLSMVLNEKANADKELDKIRKELNDFRSRRAAINEAIRLEEERIEQDNIKKIILSCNDKEDINFLISLENKFHNREALFKLIWTEYLQKPFNEMINRQFGSSIPKMAIYCIQNCKNGKIYIGKTESEVKTRWISHIKTSLEISGSRPQRIHKALFNNWGDFTFSILESGILKEDIMKKEKYWINLYESDKYGYNMKV